MPSFFEIRPQDAPPTPRTRLAVNQHRFTVPVVRPLPRRGAGAIVDARVW
jgi:hypothetical protein